MAVSMIVPQELALMVFLPNVFLLFHLHGKWNPNSERSISHAYHLLESNDHLLQQTLDNEAYQLPQIIQYPTCH